MILLIDNAGATPQAKAWGIQAGFDAPAFRLGWREVT